MNRRGFLQVFFLGNFFWLDSLFSFNKNPVKVIYKSVPKAHNYSYKSANDFFYKFYGDYGSAFNRQNMQTGKVLSMKSHLSADKKAVHMEYVYKNRKSFIECERMWQKQYPEYKDPVRHIILSIV